MGPSNKVALLLRSAHRSDTLIFDYSFSHSLTVSLPHQVFLWLEQPKQPVKLVNPVTFFSGL
jgi:hypothetical protein